jgi:ankyrin repeat protein
MFGRGRQNEAKLMEAALAGDTEGVRKVLLEKSDLVNARASKGTCRHHRQLTEGDTILHLAARCGHLPVAELLMSLKAQVNIANEKGRTPLHDAAKSGRDDIARLLVERNADPNAKDQNGRTPLHEAAVGGNPEVAQTLVARGANPSAADSHGNTPMHDAAAASAEPFVRLLEQTDADVNGRNAQGRTPLHMAVAGPNHSAAGYVDLQRQRQDEAKMIKLLLDLGAAANIVDSLGETPLDVLTYLEGEASTDPRIAALRAGGGRWVRYKHRHADDPEPQNAAEKTMLGGHARGNKSPRTPAATAVSDQADTTPIRLSNKPLTIGRAPECDVCYKSLTLSRRHARIESGENGYMISDLGSHNGTSIDGEKIKTPYRLDAGDMITLGAYEFEFDGSQLIPSHGELSGQELARERQGR